MRIFFLGDSLTRGYLVAAEASWVALVERESGCVCRNAGVNGDTTADMLHRLPALLEQCRFTSRMADMPGLDAAAGSPADTDEPDVLFVMGGGNDIFQGFSPHVPLGNLRMIAAMARAAGLSAWVGVPPPLCLEPSGDEDVFPLGLCWPGLDESTARSFEEFSQALRANCVDDGTPVVDFRSGIYDAATAAGVPAASLYLDGVHLTRAGHRVCADAFLQFFARSI